MYEIVMSGIVSKEGILILKRGLKRDCDKALTLDFFCMYSEYEILVGSTFSSFLNRKTGVSIKVNAKLVDVTQSWALPFDSIPFGHKTLARVQFAEQESVNILKNEMPVINRWEDSGYDFSLIE